MAQVYGPRPESEVSAGPPRPVSADCACIQSSLKPVNGSLMMPSIPYFYQVGVPYLAPRILPSLVFKGRNVSLMMMTAGWGETVSPSLPRYASRLLSFRHTP